MRYGLFVAIAGLLATGTAVGQDLSTKPQGETIVVTGVRDAPDRKQEALRFARALTVLDGIDPVARFDEGHLCPVVAGLPASVTAATEARMRRVAQAVGIILADPGCAPNALLIVTPTTVAETIAQMRRTHPRYFLSSRDTPMWMPRPVGPAYGWNIQYKVDRSGTTHGYSNNPADGPINTNDSMGGSRLRAQVRPAFLASFLVMEMDAVDGLTTTQLADYAAMRLFTQIDTKRLGRTSTRTIATLPTIPQDQPVPASMTAWDLAYLRALYAVDPYRVGMSQRTAMANAIAREVDGGQAATD